MATVTLSLVSLTLCFFFFTTGTSATCANLTVGYDAVYDLENGLWCPGSGVTIHQSFSGSGCSTRGVLKLALNSSTRRRVLIDFFFNSSPANWVFNLGDSRTNNGWAGDASTTIYDAEVQGRGTTLTGYRNDVHGSGQSFNQGSAYGAYLTLLAEDGRVSWVSDTSYDSVTDAGLYALNGQDNNYDLYLGLNKVVYGSRSGSGVCKAAIRFLP